MAHQLPNETRPPELVGEVWHPNTGASQLGTARVQLYLYLPHSNKPFTEEARSEIRSLT